MPRQRWIPETGEWVDVDKLRSGEYYHSVIVDEMSPTRHPCSGEIITSKHKFRDVTRQHGCYEMGNDKPKPRRVENSGEMKAEIKAVMDAGTEYRREMQQRIEKFQHIRELD